VPFNLSKVCRTDFGLWRNWPLNPRGCKIAIFRLETRHEKLLDDAGALLYCDHEFDRHLPFLYQTKEHPDFALTDLDSDNLKAAAEYLLQVARSSEGRRYRKQPKMDALREYKPEILEAHRHGLNVHRIAEIFRERGVDISKIHLIRAIRRFIEEEERASAAQGPTPAKETKSAATYQVVEQPSAVVREEEFAKQLRIARYLAGRVCRPFGR
jgi:hypothetical protein